MKTFGEFVMDLNEDVTAADLKNIEKFADKLFAHVGVDVNFTKHFGERVNHERNGKPISTSELTRLFKQTYKKHGKKIPALGDDAEAVIHDMSNDLNMPFVLKWDKKSQEFDLVAKTIMRKKDFKSPDKKIEI